MMPLPALAIGAVTKGIAALKGASIGKLLIGAYLASMGLDAAGRVGQYGLSKEQMRAQIQMGKTSAEAAKMSVKESRTRSKEYIATLLKAQKEEAREKRDLASLQSFTQSQDRQMALILQTMQSIGQQRNAARGSGAGMLGLMRSG